MSGIELSELIQQLRADLAHVMAADADESLRFELGPIELTLMVTVSRSGEASGKARFWVVDAEAKGNISRERVQALKLMLNPVDTTAAEPVQKPYRKAIITGDELVGER